MSMYPENNSHHNEQVLQRPTCLMILFGLHIRLDWYGKVLVGNML